METRIDCFPTETFDGYKIRIGRPFPFGATLVPGGVNFSVYSHHATTCTLVLFKAGEAEPLAEILFPHYYRIGDTYCMIVFDLDYENIEYGYRMDGPHDPRSGQRFDRSKVLLDPYAKLLSGRAIWGEATEQAPPGSSVSPYRCRLLLEDFDWENDRPLETPLEDLVIYEMHVRGFTRHPSANVKYPGTYAAIIEKIPYLKQLGVNAIELMPIFEFDEFENFRVNPVTKGNDYNYWGYSTAGFFAPKAGYAASGRWAMQADELKNLIKNLHRNGIEVILDVVFNHTAEGDERGPTISFRGIDNKTYYMLTPDGRYQNFSGCGNALNCNHPVVRSMVIDCLRYWAADYHIDGFRFDLASILGRNPHGEPLLNPPLLESLAFDPVLARCKLIAEAWDAGGLYQVGSFPAYGRWTEWNGKYRDDVRRFIKGDTGVVGGFAQRLQGSPDLYNHQGRGPNASLNFITCHDGFTLMDLFSYNNKHNEINGENNRDGCSDNHSWNCGVEGETLDSAINVLRLRMMKNAFATLLISQGVPMLLMGDEIGATKHGNNNTYNQDSPLNWLDWAMMEKNAEIFRFLKNMIAFRNAHPVLRSRSFFTFKDYKGSGSPDFSWHGVRPWNPDWSEMSHSLACMYCGQHAKGGSLADNTIYIAINSYWEPLCFELPLPPNNQQWHLFANTALPTPHDIVEPGQEKDLVGKEITISPRSLVILLAK